MPDPSPALKAAQQASKVTDVQKKGDEVLRLINEYRASQKLPALVLDPNLQLAAQTYANTLMQQGGEGHNVGGTTFEQRILQACVAQSDIYWYGSAGENCAHGHGSPTEALQGWKSSPKGHNENMLRPFWNAIGVGVAQRKGGQGFEWVTVFGQALPGKAEALKRSQGGLPKFKKGDQVYVRLVAGGTAQKQIEPGTIVAYLIPNPDQKDNWISLGENPNNVPVFYYGIDLGPWGTTAQSVNYIVSKADYESKKVLPPMPPTS